MRELFKILATLQERKVPFCFQCQGNFFNLSVNDLKGRNHSFSSKNIDEVETFLKTMWTPASVPPPKMPMPSFPRM